MPGPITFPLRVGFIDDITKNISTTIRQNRHAIYNAAGKHIGSYVTLDALCQGQWQKFTGEIQPPFAQLYVSDFWGRKVPASTLCVKAAQATAKGGSIIYPQPVQPASAAKAVEQAQAGSGAPLPPVQDLDPANLPDPAAVTRYGTYAIYGAAALAGLVLLTSGGQRRR